MKGALPDNAKIAKEAKECMQECVSEFISFITSEGESRVESVVLLSGKEKRADENGFVHLQHQRNASRRNVKQSTAKTSSSP